MKPSSVGRVMPPRPFSPPVTSVQRNDDRVEHRRQRQRQQREIDAAPAQDQEAERGGDDRDDQDAGNASGRRTSPCIQLRCSSAAA